MCFSAKLVLHSGYCAPPDIPTCCRIDNVGERSLQVGFNDDLGRDAATVFAFY